MLLDSHHSSPCVSVIVPAYNPPLSAFEETLASLRASTFSDFNLILVDDGSTNPAFQTRLAALPNEWPGVTVLHHAANRGLSAARNTGVQHCDTPYFVQLDADDQLAPTFIEKALWLLATHPQWSFCNSWLEGFGARHYRWEGSFAAGPLFRYENCVSSLAMVRRQSDRSIAGHDEAIRAGAEDWDYWLRMAAHGLWGVTVPEYLLRYRHHAVPTFWANRDDLERQAQFARSLRQRFALLWQRPFPEAAWTRPEQLDDELPFDWPGPSAELPPHVLVLLSDWADAKVALACDHLGASLAREGFGVTWCATDTGARPTDATPPSAAVDSFTWGHFLRPKDRPRFLRYLVERRPVVGVVRLASRASEELLPYLRARFPGLPCHEYPLGAAAFSRAEASAPLTGTWASIFPARAQRVSPPASQLSEILADYDRLIAAQPNLPPWWLADTPWLRRHRSWWYHLKHHVLRPARDRGWQRLTRLVGRSPNELDA